MFINQLKTKKGYCLVLLILAMACSVKGYGQTGEEYYKKGKEERIFFIMDCILFDKKF